MRIETRRGELDRDDAFDDAMCDELMGRVTMRHERTRSMS